MSIKEWGAWVGAVLVVGVAGFFTFAGSDVADGLHNERADPRLVTSGTAAGQEWAMVSVGKEAFADCMEFRTAGVRQLQLCGTTYRGDRYEVDVTEVNGVTMFAAVLPEKAAHAELAMESSEPLLPRRHSSTATVPVEIRTFGKSVRYVVGVAPAGVQWRDYEGVPLVVTDERGGRLTP
jgi:hypothetical protein